MLWRLRQTVSRDESWSLGYFKSKRALLQYCKDQIGTDNPALAHGSCDIAVIGRSLNPEGVCNVESIGSVVFEGVWVDGNIHCINYAIPTFNEELMSKNKAS